MINRETGFQYPDIRTFDVPPLTPGIPGQVGKVADTYGNLINQKLQNPSAAYGDYVLNRTGPAATDIQPDEAVTGAVSALNSLWGLPTRKPGRAATLGKKPTAQELSSKHAINADSELGKAIMADAGKDGGIAASYGYGAGDPGTPDSFEPAAGFNINDVLAGPENAYRASLDEANRQFSTYLLPQLKESFGKRGLRYSSAIADAGARAYGDIQANLGTKAAEAKLGVNRDVLNAGLNRAQILNQIGIGNTALRQQNQAKDYQEFLRTQPDAFFNAAQAFLGTRPIYPQVVTGGQPVLTQNPSQLDSANQYLDAISRIVSAIPAATAIFS